MLTVSFIAYGLAIVLAPMLFAVSRLSARRRETDLKETFRQVEELNTQLVRLHVKLDVQSDGAGSQKVAKESAALRRAAAELKKLHEAEIVHARIADTLRVSWYSSNFVHRGFRAESESKIRSYVKRTWADPTKQTVESEQVVTEFPIPPDERDWTVILQKAEPEHWC
jgi:hypothetical protein